MVQYYTNSFSPVFLMIFIITAIILLEAKNEGKAVIENVIGVTEITISSATKTYIPVGFGLSGSDSGSSESESSDSSSEEDIVVPEGGTADAGPCAAGFPKVDVRATDIEGLSLLPVWHLFVIYVDCSGTEFFFRGGPGGPGGDSEYGTIKGTSGLYTSDTVDWDPEAHSITVTEGSSASGADSCFQSELSRIENTGISYSVLGPNSNTVAKTPIVNCGFTPEKPVTIAPGWGDPAL